MRTITDIETAIAACKTDFDARYLLGAFRHRYSRRSLQQAWVQLQRDIMPLLDELKAVEAFEEAARITRMNKEYLIRRKRQRRIAA